MISNTELKKNLKKDGIILDDNQLNAIRTFLVQMATLEYNYHKKNKKVNTKNDFNSNIIIELYPREYQLKIAS